MLTHPRSSFRRLSASAVIGLALPLLAASQNAPGVLPRTACACFGGESFNALRAMPPPLIGFRVGRPGDVVEPIEAAVPAWLCEVSLSDTQEDKIFSIVLAASPSLRENAKALRKAYADLHELALSPKYSEDKAHELANAAGMATLKLAQRRTALEHDINAVLTPEQRQQLQESQQDRNMQCGGPAMPPGAISVGPPIRR
jgi:protein CpxP